MLNCCKIFHFKPKCCRFTSFLSNSFSALIGSLHFGLPLTIYICLVIWFRLIGYVQLPFYFKLHKNLLQKENRCRRYLVPTDKLLKNLPEG